MRDFRRFKMREDFAELINPFLYLISSLRKEEEEKGSERLNSFMKCQNLENSKIVSNLERKDNSR
jgi:hypothetical protein